MAVHEMSAGGRAGYATKDAHSGLLETLRRIDVRPDSVQVLGGQLSFGLPAHLRVWLTFGLRPAGHRDEAWLKRGLPSS